MERENPYLNLSCKFDLSENVCHVFEHMSDSLKSRETHTDQHTPRCAHFQARL